MGKGILAHPANNAALAIAIVMGAVLMAACVVGGDDAGGVRRETGEGEVRMNRINLICLGVRDIVASRAFYRDGLGFATVSAEERPEVVFFNNNGTRLELFPIEGLRRDIDEDNPPPLADGGFNGITLAYNAKTREEVDAIFARIESLGGSIAKMPTQASWGGYSGYFRDLDGYYWEVAHWDGWQFDANDMLVVD